MPDYTPGDGATDGDDNGPSLLEKLRPTAVVFALIMGALAWILTHNVLSGPVGAAAFGEGQAVAIVTAALLIIGAAVNSLGNAMLKLSEDSKPDPPPAVPETTVIAMLRAVSKEAAAPAREEMDGDG